MTLQTDELREFLDERAAGFGALRKSSLTALALDRASKALADAADERDALRERVRALEGENERLREALIPSGHTKAAYMGEFWFPVEDMDEDGNEYTHKQYVPWTTIKEIMAVIFARAALKETSRG